MSQESSDFPLKNWVQLSYKKKATHYAHVCMRAYTVSLIVCMLR